MKERIKELAEQAELMNILADHVKKYSGFVKKHFGIEE